MKDMEQALFEKDAQDDNSWLTPEVIEELKQFKEDVENGTFVGIPFDEAVVKVNGRYALRRNS